MNLYSFADSSGYKGIDNILPIKASVFLNVCFHQSFLYKQAEDGLVMDNELHIKYYFF